MVWCLNRVRALVSKTNKRKETGKRLTRKSWLNMKNNQNCTHPVPKNKYGIVAMHCADNQPISRADLMKVINGPIAAIESDYQAEISQPADWNKCRKEFDPHSVLLECCPAPLPEETKIAK
jgi:hypothetical protein